MLRVLHLAGSAESAFLARLSRLYAADCLEVLDDRSRYEHVVAYVTPDGRWRFPADLSPAALGAAPTLGLAEAVAHIGALGADVAVPQMFCRAGMTHYRALLELLGLPVLGNPPQAMALTAHKARAKAVVAAAGVRVPAGELLRPGDAVEVALPVVVKPVDADNSSGVALVREASELAPALAAAFAHSGEVLVEEFVPLGREVRCGILERDGELVCLPLEEYAVDAVTKPVRDQDDKLGEGDDGGLKLMAKEVARAWIVAEDDPVVEAVWAAALRCHVALGCRDYSLFDFRIDPDGEAWFLEASLYCSFARTSVVAVMAAAAGISTTALFDHVVAGALARGNDDGRPWAPVDPAGVVRRD